MSQITFPTTPAAGADPERGRASAWMPVGTSSIGTSDLSREVQVEHHLDDDSYVLDVLFSWHSHTG